ncbi:T9SS type A sorting domain-containing protein, partial [candidate division WOR-3 bacterium]|nr:T9SS type A sorting domain-containing protein [candidate division WOR-3 bacterium]
IPTSWQRSKQYEDIQGITKNIVNDSMDSGFNLQHWVGHGNEYGIAYNLGATYFYYYTDPSTNTNDSTRTSIINSMSCFLGALDEVPGGDCLAERLINSNKNACVATIMNTRYGWGYSSPEGALGPSAEITVAFYRNLFNTSAYHLGEVFANALDDIASAANSNSYWRWSVYEHMLFGDPEMPIWTDIPQNFTVIVSPDSAIQDTDNIITVTVTDGAKASVSGALVTFAQDDFYVYEKELTSAGGIATVTINPPGIGDTIYITVTKDNFIPYETYILSVKGTAGIKQKTLNNELLKIRSNRNTIDIQFSLSKTSNVKCDIIDISGRMIKRIDKQFTAGKNSLSISSKDMKRGVYFVKLNGNGFSKIKKIAIIR